MFSSFGASLRDMVYEKDSSAPSAKPTPTTAAKPSAGMSVQSGVNTAMVEAIKKMTFGRNTAFTQLLQTATALEDVIPDQTMRLKAAHKTAGGGRTGKQIAEAVDVHLQDVDGEVMRFKAAVEKKTEAEVGGLKRDLESKEAQIARCLHDIENAQNSITSLNATILELKTQASQLDTTIIQNQNELAKAESEFAVAAQVVRDDLNNSKSAILSTLV